MLADSKPGKYDNYDYRDGSEGGHDLPNGGRV
jgi:hypothetical protein